jgi:putative YhbY family RNA-binding protein
MNDLTPTLTPAQRRAFRAQAHHLQPVVAIGQHGLTPSVLHEIDLALTKHELIKVRVFADDRGTRETLLATVCAELGCLAVQHLGKLLIIYRFNPDQKDSAARKTASAGGGKARASAKATGTNKDKGKKTYKVRNAVHTPVDPVRERRRTTADGLVSGKGRRGAARHQSPDDAAPPEPVRGRRTSAGESPPADPRRGRRTSAGDGAPPAARRGGRSPEGDSPPSDITRRRYGKPAAPFAAPDSAPRRRKPTAEAPAADASRRRRKVP